MLEARRSNDAVYSSSEQLRRIGVQVDQPYGSAAEPLRRGPDDRIYSSGAAYDPRGPQPGTDIRPGEGIHSKPANIPIDGLRIVDGAPHPIYGGPRDAGPQRDVIADQPDYDDDDDVGERAPPTVASALAEELRSKLGKGQAILLPPKDYDTVRRTHGDLRDIEARKCLNKNIVGKGGEVAGKDARANQFESTGKTRPGLNVFGNG